MAGDDGNKIDTKDDELHKFIRENTDKIKIKNELDVKKIIFQTKIENHEYQIRRLSVGEMQNGKPSKSILLVGETGAGKTALISSLVNKYMGIEYEDNFRLSIGDKECEIKSQTESQTESITVYEFSHMSGMKCNYNLTIIDTPGLNDTKGLDHDKKLFENLEMLLKDDKFDVDEIHCIGFVVKSSTNRLTPGQKYVYDGCMRLFGNDVKNKINILATFSDGSDPQIVDGLEEMGVGYVELYKFNNSSMDLNNNPTHNRAAFNKLHWKDMDKSCGDFLNYLSTSNGQSLTKSKETLETRRLLYKELENLNPTFIENISKAITETKKGDIVKHTDGYTRCNKSYNCTKCQVTCHRPCYNSTFYKCENCKEILRKGKECTVCECPPENHAREDFHYDCTYLLDDKNKENTLKVIKSLEKIRLVMERLERVALKPIPSSFEDYIVNIIEKDESKLGKEQKKMLNNLQQQEIKVQIVLNYSDEMEKLCQQLDSDLKIKMERGNTALCCSVM